MPILSITEIKKIEDKTRRLAAVNGLDSSALNGADIQELIELLADAYWPVREAAAKKLIASGTRVCENLVNAISGPDEDIKFWSSQILSAIADERAIELLINSFAFYQENEINMYSARALVKIGPFTGTQLIKSLSSSDDLIRLYSLYCIGEIKIDEALPYIHKLLAEDVNFAVRKNAATALGKICSHSSINALIDAISDKSWYVRIAATEALGKFKFLSEESVDQTENAVSNRIDEEAGLKERITNSILASLSDTEARVRETGVKVLSELGGVQIQRQLIKLLQNSESEGEKIIAVKNIDDSAAAESLPVISAIMAGRCSAELKKEVLKALGRMPIDEAKAYIIPCISDEDSEIVKIAIASLFNIRTGAACDVLSSIVEDPREEARCAVFEALGRNEYFDMRHHLYSALEDSSYLVRRQAMLSLYLLLGDEAVSEVIAMINDSDEFVASEAINIVSKLKSSDAIPALARAVEKGSNRLAYMAFQALGSIGVNAEYVILNNLCSDNRDICYWAINALEKTASKNCIVPLIDTIKKYSSQQEIVERALDVLLQFDFEIDEKFFVDILKNLKSSHNKALELLSKSKKPETAFEVLPYLKSGDKETRFQAAKSLGRIANDDEKVIGALIEALKDRYWPVRKVAAESLAFLGNRAVKSLERELERTEANADIVYWALRALADKAMPGIAAVFEKYLDSKNADIVKIIIKGLGRAGDNDSIKLLMRFFKSENDEIRFHAVKSLKNCSNPIVLSSLIEMMNDNYENVRSFAAIALGNFKTPEAVNTLKNALNDKSRWVVKYARESLSRLID